MNLKISIPLLEAENRKLFERYQLYNKMAQNDFTKIALPDCAKVNCEDFIEVDSGLEPRTFVGPVIFLSNSYKDAMRATDNLDEARCHEQIEGVDYQLDQIDSVEREILSFENSVLSRDAATLLAIRDNNAYRYNKYFSSLRQFCVREVKPTSKRDGHSKVEFYPKQVDDLIHEEAALKADYLAKMKALATPYNFASIFNLDFFSFKGEKLRRVDDKRVRDGCAEKDLDTCLVDTEERALSETKLLEMANRDLGSRTSSARWHLTTTELTGPLGGKRSFGSVEDLRPAFFGAGYESASTVPICGILASTTGESYVRAFPSASAGERELVERVTFRECFWQGREGFLRDRKLRIYSTGDYAFMGGMQLNFNVTYGFSVGRSTSASASVDLVDIGKQVVGPMGAFVVGNAFGGPFLGGASALAVAVIKPFDLKRSTSMSSSSGTSISEQTYLVGQIAKFSIPLKEWEQCVAIRLFPKTVQSLRSKILGSFVYGEDEAHDVYARFAGQGVVAKVDDGFDDKINQVFGRGIFICDGEHRTVEELPGGKKKLGKDIDELYFYFTQHFTEGDMLDQADLYNNPWLLSLRGLRDFSAFVQLIRGQEVVGLDNLRRGIMGERPSEKPAYALDHMANIYKAILPTFPGLYTQLEEGDGMNFFPLKSKSFTFRDEDVNAEVNRVVTPARASATGRSGASSSGSGASPGR